VSLRGMLNDAKKMIPRGDQSEIEGYIIMGAIAPILGDRDGLIKNFEKASRIAPDWPVTWLNDANFSPKVGLIARAAAIVRERVLDAQIEADVAVIKSLLDTAISCGLVDTIPVLSEKLTKLGVVHGKEETFPYQIIKSMLSERGLDERDLVERLDVASTAAFNTVRKPILGFSMVGDAGMGFSYEFVIDPQSEHELALADAAIANAITSTFEDDFSDIMTFSTRGIN